MSESIKSFMVCGSCGETIIVRDNAKHKICPLCGEEVDIIKISEMEIYDPEEMSA